MTFPESTSRRGEGSALGRFRTRAHLESQRLIGQWLVFLAPYFITGPDPAVRRALPEPFDVFNHAANMEVSAAVGFGVGQVTHKAYASYLEHGESPRRAIVKARAAMAAGGLIAGVALNALTETKLGISISHITNTPDPLDLAYGALSAAVAAATGPSLEAVTAEAL